MIKNLIAQTKKKEGWHLLYRANIDAAETAKSMNIDTTFSLIRQRKVPEICLNVNVEVVERYYDNIAEMERRGFVNEETVPL